MITTNEVLEFLSGILPYEQKLVNIIDAKGRQIQVSSFGELLSYRAQGASIKIEGMERYSKAIYEQGLNYGRAYNHSGPVTCHLFMAFEGSPSFPMHTDPDSVVIHCCEGAKSMLIGEKYIVLLPNMFTCIPANYPHQALNEHDAITLSFGLERFLKDKAHELDLLSQDNGNL